MGEDSDAVPAHIEDAEIKVEHIVQQALQMARSEDEGHHHFSELFKLSVFDSLGLGTAKMKKRHFFVALMWKRALQSSKKPPLRLKQLLDAALVDTLSKRQYETLMHAARHAIKDMFDS